ncbi:hypothetical protein [Aquamicrobium sp. LC103]|uniref:hypothetical protein n=1 Tax=Aquamicrobium sp. LC103 TaxID=1120658 RepID=UPI00148535E0|nr:hypothetical protein [Aquamicrobium sp. LC103]
MTMQIEEGFSIDDHAEDVVEGLSRTLGFEQVRLEDVVRIEEEPRDSRGEPIGSSHRIE